MWVKLGWLNWFWQFLCKRLSSFSLERLYYSYAWSCSLCERRTSFCMGLVSRKLFRFLLFFWLALLRSVSYFFFLYQSPSSLLCMAFDSISSNIDKVFSINPSAYVLVFGDFNIHLKDWITCFGGTDRPCEL